MKTVALLDSGPLGDICNPNLRVNIKSWIDFIKEKKIALRVAEIIEYELRRNFILENLTKSERNLYKYRQTQRIVPITSSMMLEAAAIWAELRARGLSTANEKSIDIDVILAAQALSLKVNFERVIIVTTNPKHIYRFSDFGIKTWDWKQALNDCTCGEINLYKNGTV